MKYGTWLGKLWHSEPWTGNLRGAISREKYLFLLNDSCDSDTIDGFRVQTADLLCGIVLSIDPRFVEKGLAS